MMESCAHEKEQKVIIRANRRWSSFLRRIHQLADGRYMLTITKSDEAIDLTVLDLGRVERIS